MAIQQQIGDRSGMCPTMHNIASIYLFQKKNTEQWFAYESGAFQIAIEIGYTEGIYRIGGGFGSILCQMGQREDGLPILKIALEAGSKAKYPDLDDLINIIKKNQ